MSIIKLIYKSFKDENMKEVLDTVINWATNAGVKIVIALVVLFVSFKLINFLAKKISKKLDANSKVDKTLAKTLTYIIKIALKILIGICLIGYLGIETSGLSALVASLGVCAGLAVNGTLANLAGGVMILITRPIKLGDYISAQGSEGTVEDIRICYTKIATSDNKVIYLPNSSLSTGTIVNFSEEKTRRVDLDFSVGGNDPEKVKAIVLDACKEESLVLGDPAPFARVTDYGAGNGVKVTVRAWSETENYWDARFNLLENIQKKFDAEGIVIPFNQLDVHVKNN